MFNGMFDAKPPGSYGTDLDVQFAASPRAVTAEATCERTSGSRGSGRSSSPTRRHESSVDEPAKVATRSRRRNIGLAAVAGSISTADQRLLERDDETIWPATARNKVLEERPPHTGFLDLPKTLARLNEVSLDAERDPLRRVARRLISATLDSLQDCVVLGGMRSEIFLDRCELWRQQALAGQHQ